MTTELTIRLEDKEAHRMKKALASRNNKVRQQKAELWSDDPRNRDTAELSAVRPEDLDTRQVVNKILQYGLKELED